MSVGLVKASEMQARKKGGVIYRAATWLRDVLGRLVGLSYYGATKGRKASTFTDSHRSARSEVSRALPTLRSRSRWLLRNNPHAVRAAETLLNNVIADGIWPKPRTGNPRLNARAEALFREWATECDATGATQWAALTRMAFRASLSDGDVLIQFVRRASSSALSVPLQLRVLESDFLASSLTTSGKNRVIDGVEVDANGRTVAYHLHRAHPGDDFRYSTFGSSGDVVRVRASEIVQLMKIERPGQVRGIPFLAPVITTLKDIDDFIDNEGERKKMESCLVGFVNVDEYSVEGEDEDGIRHAVIDADGNPVEDFVRGMIAIVRGNREITIHEPKAVPNFEEWTRVMLRQVSVGVGVPYPVLTDDLASVNFSSMKGGLNEFRRKCKAYRNAWLIPLFLDRVWRRFIEAAIFAGQLPAGDYPVQWSQPKFESVEPLKDVKAAKERLRLGLSSVPQEIADDGGDVAEVLAQQAEFAQQASAAGLRFDSLPADDSNRVDGDASRDVDGGDGDE